ncbi:hypothetical protein ML5_0875 [Micromonospora sp. L5]|uniref:hypothetical protein n=1 Tax=Micromonospora sp. (strain L5) TaxID=648999 RepID=UPI0001C45C9B|nr:hypothetical protein [Micromonospora sp. L5]ADU06417.1 hypothetical protein ML5_0875 [Micromonospora sp. L5]
MNNVHESRLSCGHRVSFDPVPFKGDIVWCYRCTDYRTVNVRSLFRSRHSSRKREEAGR